MNETMLGVYGSWAAGILGEGAARLSFRQPIFQANGIEKWRNKARRRLKDCLRMPAGRGTPTATLLRRFEFEGLHVEQLQWQLPYGPPTQALFLKPKGAKGRLPAVLALHDHGGKKYFGLRKITRMLHPHLDVLRPVPAPGH